MDHALCPSCAFEFVLDPLNQVDDETYECPNCHHLSNVKELFIFEL
jgi:hypothetical protein